MDETVASSASSTSRRSTRSTRGQAAARLSPQHQNRRQVHFEEQVRRLPQSTPQRDGSNSPEQQQQQEPPQSPNAEDDLLDLSGMSIDGEFFVAVSDTFGCVFVESVDELNEADSRHRLVAGARVRIPVFGPSNVVFFGFETAELAREAAREHSIAQNVRMGTRVGRGIVYHAEFVPVEARENAAAIERANRITTDLEARVRDLERENRLLRQDFHQSMEELRDEIALIRQQPNPAAPIHDPDDLENVAPAVEILDPHIVPPLANIQNIITDAPSWSHGVTEAQARAMFAANPILFKEQLFNLFFNELEIFLKKLPRHLVAEYKNIVKLFTNAITPQQIREVDINFEDLLNDERQKLKNRITRRVGVDGGAMLQSKTAIPLVREASGIYSPVDPQSVTVTRRNETAAAQYFLIHNNGVAEDTMFATISNPGGIRNKYNYFVIRCNGTRDDAAR